MKVKVSNTTEADLKRIGELQLKKAKALYQSQPFVTKTWMAMRGFPMSWLNDNWTEITN